MGKMKQLAQEREHQDTLDYLLAENHEYWVDIREKDLRIMELEKEIEELRKSK